MPRRSKRGRRKAKQQRRKLADGTVELKHLDPETGEVDTDYIAPHSRQTVDEELLGGKLPADLSEPVLDDPRVRHDDDTRLQTGITVKDLVMEAEMWWRGRGQKAMQDGRKSQVRRVRSARHYKGPITFDPDDPNALPSGVLHGLDWDHLNRAEKLSVCKAYHLVRYKVPYDQAMGSQLISPN